MRSLTLALKGEYFDAIKAGTKTEEYRLVTPYWQRRLSAPDGFDLVILTRGYPSSDDTDRRLVLPWQGYVIKEITHPHFGDAPVQVYAINVAPLPGEQWKPSNGTVGHSFVVNVCGDCERDRDEDCNILARSFRGEAVEWRRTDEDGCFCMAYRPRGDAIPAPPCGHTLPLPLEGGPTQAVGQIPASGQKGLVHGGCVTAAGAGVPRKENA